MGMTYWLERRPTSARNDKISEQFGVWRSLVAHLLWEQGAAGSNPATPTILTWTGPRACARFVLLSIAEPVRLARGNRSERRTWNAASCGLRLVRESPRGEQARGHDASPASQRCYRALRATTEAHREVAPKYPGAALRPIGAGPRSSSPVTREPTSAAVHRRRTAPHERTRNRRKGRGGAPYDRGRPLVPLSGRACARFRLEPGRPYTRVRGPDAASHLRLERLGMSTERGLKRLTCVIATLLAVVVIWSWAFHTPGGFALLFGIPLIGDLLIFLLIVPVIPLVFAIGIPWAVFFASRWVYRGFKRDPEA